MNKTELAFFLSRVEKGAGRSACWLWTGARGGSAKHPYGVYKGTTAHRVAYAHFVGPLPPTNGGRNVVHHTCSNGLCVNPRHLVSTTQRKNLRLSPLTVNAINAAKTHCVNGHKFTPKNTYISPTNGQRVCRMCKRDWARKARREERA